MVLQEKSISPHSMGGLGEIVGNEIEAKMEKETDPIVILGRNIGISTFQGTCIELFTNRIYI